MNSPFVMSTLLQSSGKQAIAIDVSWGLKSHSLLPYQFITWLRRGSWHMTSILLNSRQEILFILQLFYISFSVVSMYFSYVIIDVKPQLHFDLVYPGHLPVSQLIYMPMTSGSITGQLHLGSISRYLAEKQSAQKKKKKFVIYNKPILEFFTSIFGITV